MSQIIKLRVKDVLHAINLQNVISITLKGTTLNINYNTKKGDGFAFFALGFGMGLGDSRVIDTFTFPSEAEAKSAFEKITGTKQCIAELQ